MVRIAKAVGVLVRASVGRAGEEGLYGWEFEGERGYPGVW